MKFVKSRKKYSLLLSWNSRDWFSARRNNRLHVNAQLQQVRLKERINGWRHLGIAYSLLLSCNSRDCFAARRSNRLRVNACSIALEVVQTSVPPIFFLMLALWFSPGSIIIAKILFADTIVRFVYVGFFCPSPLFGRCWRKAHRKALTPFVKCSLSLIVIIFLCEFIPEAGGSKYECPLMASNVWGWNAARL